MLSTMRRVVRISLGCSIAFGAVFAATGAHANPEFPMLLEQNVPMPCLPPCTLCHNTLAGGPGNLKPSGIVKTWTDPSVLMSSNVLDGNNPNSLVPALAAIKALSPPLDTDKDGVPDLMELMMGDDPDVAGGPPLCVAGQGPTGPVYGCARVAPQGKVDNVAAAASVIVGLLGIAALRRRVTKKRARRV